MITSQDLNSAVAGLAEEDGPIISSSSPSTPTRATFPYKPASLTPTGTGQRSVFRPLVPSMTPPQAKSQKKHLFQRCKTFPIDTSTTTKATEKIIEAPSWLTDNFTQNQKSCFYFEDVLTFPVSLSTQDSPCWWLDDMTNWEPIKEHPHTTVKAFLMELRRETIEADVSSSSTHSLVDDDERKTELDTALRDLLELDRMPDMLPLWRQIIELRRYIERAYHLHEDRRERMQVILKNIESVVNNTTGNGKSREVVHSESNEEIQAASSMEDLTRKTTVGLTGGTLVTAGLVLIPAPVIPGILVVYGGLLVLASEFDSAKTAVNAMQGPMKHLLRDEEDPNQGIYDCFHNILWEELIEYSSAGKELDEDFMVIMKLKPWKDDGGDQNGGGKDVEIERIKREKKNAMKRYARQILLLEDKDTDDTPKKHGEDLANSECGNVT